MLLGFFHAQNSVRLFGFDEFERKTMGYSAKLLVDNRSK